MIKREDIYADLHTHSIFSKHAYSTIKENIEIAKENGLQYIAITDHFYGNGDELEKKNETNRIEYLEKSIRPYEDDIVVIGGTEFNLGQEMPFFHKIKNIKWRPIGVHSWFWNRENKTLEDTYNAFANAIENNKHNALAHIEREIHKLDNGKYGDKITNEIIEFYEKIIKIAKENNVFLEVNESSIRSNECGGIARLKCWLTLAKENKNLIYLGTDAHYCKQVGDFSQTINLLNEIKYPKELILNCNLELLEKVFNN